MKRMLLIASLAAFSCRAAEPVAPVGQVKIASVDRTWKVVYGTTEGPEGRALELLSSEVGSLYVRDPGVYTLHVLPCERSGASTVPQMTNAFVIGTLKSNAELAKLVKPGGAERGGQCERRSPLSAGARGGDVLERGRTLRDAGAARPRTTLGAVSSLSS